MFYSLVHADFDIEYFLINKWNGIYEWEIPECIYFILNVLSGLSVNVKYLAVSATRFTVDLDH